MNNFKKIKKIIKKLLIQKKILQNFSLKICFNKIIWLKRKCMKNYIK
jgi:hypothetical protein